MALQVGSAAEPESFHGLNLEAVDSLGQTLTWYRLEEQRMRSLKLSNKYSRHFNVLRTSKQRQLERSGTMYHLSGVAKPGVAGTNRPSAERTARGASDVSEEAHKSNSIAPFATVGKPTCGYFFSRETDNKKKKFGIPPSDLVKWRNF